MTYRYPILLIALLALCTPTPSHAYLGPVFDLDRMYHAAPVVAKVVVEETREIAPIHVEEVEGIQWEGAEMLARVATLNVLRAYKGTTPERIELLFPYWVKGTEASFLSWQTVAEGDSVIVFLKPEGESYRFWYDVYDSKINVTGKTSTEKDPYKAFRADIIQSIADKGPTAIECMRSVATLGWQDALPAVKAITWKDGAGKKAIALLTRLQLGDRSAYPEAISLFAPFSRPDPWPDEREVNNARYGCLYVFARQGHREALELLNSIASGKTPATADIKTQASQYLTNSVTPKGILDAGNALEKKAAVNGMDARLAYVVAEAAGRNDWYNKARQSEELRAEVVPQIQDWWKIEGRALFEAEVKEPEGR